MKRQTKLTSQEQEELAAAQQTRHESAREFASVDELLRHDALHIPVPPAISHRLHQSLGDVPSRGRPWWRRLLGS